jgi:hypothetical protein
MISKSTDILNTFTTARRLSLAIAATVVLSASTDCLEVFASSLEGGAKVSLSDKEKSIARELNYDESVLLLIKETLNPEMGIIKSGGMEEQNHAFLQANHNQPIQMLEKDIRNYHEISRKFPELKAVVDDELPHDIPDYISNEVAKREREERERLGDAKYERKLKYYAARAPFEALILQELSEEHPTQKGRHFYRRIESESIFDSDDALQFAIQELQKKYEGKVLKEANQTKSMLALKFKGVGDHLFDADRRTATLQKKLEALGYRISEQNSQFEERKQFETREEALRFLRDYGIHEQSLLALTEQKQSVRQAIYPIDYQKDLDNIEDAKTIVVQSSTFLDRDSDCIPDMIKAIKTLPSEKQLDAFGRQFRLSPGATVTKVGDRRWMIDTPTRFTATASLRTATVFKLSNQKDSFELVRTTGTNGLNYDLTNEDIIAKLQYWDKKYGVIVTEARPDSVEIRFKDLPEDLSELYTEFFLFCPDIEMSENEHWNAARMRELAGKLRKTKKMSFWWD